MRVIKSMASLSFAEVLAIADQQGSVIKIVVEMGKRSKSDRVLVSSVAIAGLNPAKSEPSSGVEVKFPSLDRSELIFLRPFFCLLIRLLISSSRTT
jgi:hypothetical protein